MMKTLLFVIMLLVDTVAFATSVIPAAQTFEVFCYHDVKDEVDGDLEQEDTTISTKNLARHFAWLQAHGYHPISVSDLLVAKAGKNPLPSKPVLLTFIKVYILVCIHC